MSQPSIAYDFIRWWLTRRLLECLLIKVIKDQPEDHVRRITAFAVDAITAANTVQIDPEDPGKGFVQIRVGFHSGPVVADVVGTRYDGAWFFKRIVIRNP